MPKTFVDIQRELFPRSIDEVLLSPAIPIPIPFLCLSSEVASHPHYLAQFTPFFLVGGRIQILGHSSPPVGESDGFVSTSEDGRFVEFKGFGLPGIAWFIGKASPVPGFRR
jgi:hypothetical protein